MREIQIVSENVESLAKRLHTLEVERHAAHMTRNVHAGNEGNDDDKENRGAGSAMRLRTQPHGDRRMRANKCPELMKLNPTVPGNTAASRKSSPWPRMMTGQRASGRHVAPSPGKSRVGLLKRRGRLPLPCQGRPW